MWQPAIPFEVKFSNGTFVQIMVVGVPAVDKHTGLDVGFGARRFRKLEELQAEAKLRQKIEQPAPAKP